MSETLTIGTDRIAVAVDPAAGGRVAQITLDGTDLLVARGSAPNTTAATAWGSYPMVPWAGRIRRGRFRFRGREFWLPVNFDGHAIHGVGFATPWEVIGADADAIVLRLALPTDARWPLGGVSYQRIVVADAAVRMELSVTAVDQAMPASIGWHPWFRKPTRLEFHPTAMWRRDVEHVTVDERIPVPPGPWDDCFDNEQPVGIEIDGRSLRLRSDCPTWVVYDLPPHATCIEPETGPPDAVTIRPRVLEPGETLSAWYEIGHVDRPVP